MQHKYKYGILCAALASALFGAPSFGASTATSSSNAAGTGTANANNAGIGTSTSLSNSGSTAGATANGGTGMAIGTGGNGGAGTSVVNFSYVDPPAPATSGDPTNTENLVTSGTQRIITTGAAIAPSIYSNNVCALSASAAGGFLGGAFALGFDRVDKGCDRRAWASLLGHYAEIYSIAAAHAPDPQTRQLALREASVYAQWANNYICMQNEELAAAAPPGSDFCHMVATQAGMQVVPAPVAAYMPPKQMAVATPVALADPPPKPAVHPRAYEAVSTSVRTGPINGYNGPDYSEDFKD